MYSIRCKLTGIRSAKGNKYPYHNQITNAFPFLFSFFIFLCFWSRNWRNYVNCRKVWNIFRSGHVFYNIIVSQVIYIHRYTSGKHVKYWRKLQTIQQHPKWNIKFICTCDLITLIIKHQVHLRLHFFTRTNPLDVSYRMLLHGRSCCGNDGYDMSAYSVSDSTESTVQVRLYVFVVKVTDACLLIL